MRKTRYNITIASLIAKYPKDELTERESLILSNWLAASGSNKVLFDDLINNVDSNLEERKKALSTAKKEKLWNRIENKTNQRRANLISALQMAASIILICGAFTLIYLKKNPYLLMAKQNLYVAESNIVKCPTLITDDKEILLDKSLNIDQNNVNLRTTGESGLIYKTMNSDNSNIKVSYHTIVVPKGSEYKLMLADGTHVWLNSDTKLKYPTSFKGKYRKVFLEGEAFFDVTKDKEHPFIVKVHDVDVKVLGTSFNVNSYDKGGNITTTLVEGKVKIENQKSNISKIIYPNEQLVFSNDKLSFIVHKVDTRLYTAWKTGRFVFSEDRLESIMNRLSRTYDVEVRFENEKLKDLHFSGDLLKYKKIDNLLEILELTNRVEFLKKNHIILVK
jgi:ferric-dicitrate binding protein FerR (iron transport regulator)